MLKFAANVSMMFAEVEFLDRFKLAADAGFKAVEFTFPYEFAANDVKQRLDDAKLELVLFNAPLGDAAAGERGFGAIPGQESRFLETIDQALQYARILGTPRMHVMAGITKGFDQAECLEVFKSNLTKIAPKFAELDVDILIEPINLRDNPGYFLSQIDAAIAIIEALSIDNVKLQFDFYHRQIMHGNILAGLEKALPYIGHLQIAGPPLRHEPDAGEVNFDPIFKYLNELPYQGWIGCEYNPANSTVTGLQWLRKLQDKGIAQ